MLLVHNSTFRDTAASGLARERALITMHLGITLGIGGPVCSNVILMLLVVLQDLGVLAIMGGGDISHAVEKKTVRFPMHYFCFLFSLQFYAMLAF